MEPIHLRDATRTLSPDCKALLREAGFFLSHTPQPGKEQGIAWDHLPTEEWRKRFRLGEDGMSGAIPYLLLLCGTNLPYGSSEWLQRELGRGAEVVRLYLAGSREQVVIGGDGYWATRLRRRLADAGSISIVCGRNEADQIAESHRSYLAHKQLFYYETARICDHRGISLSLVGRALGMDMRIGQGWMPFENEKDMPSVLLGEKKRWMKVEVEKYAEQNPNVRKVVVSVTDETDIPSVGDWGIPRDAEVSLHVVENPNVSTDQEKEELYARLEGADLLVIWQAGASMKEADLARLVRCMRFPVVLDACAIYPPDEAKALGVRYRTWGENTNVWNEAEYDRE